jgi:cytochrome c peroxidase
MMRSIGLIILFMTAVWTVPLWGGDIPLGLPALSIPDDNPQTPEKIALGKRLYEDTRFSGDGTVSCATCHDPEKGFGDGLATGEGIGKQRGTRNSPTVINAAYYDTQFWDGRRPSLEEQAKDPFLNPIEHGLETHEPILEIIRSDKTYPAEFKTVFGIEVKGVTIDHAVKAIAAFERTVIAGDSPFDHYLFGGDESAISEAAKRGLELYRTKGRCQDCHAIGQTEAIFTDNKFHNLGVGFDKIESGFMQIAKAFRKAKNEGQAVDEKVLTDQQASELGRFAVTLSPSDIGRFKTPTLRNVTVTGPYMHDGSLETLEEVMDLYNKGGEENPLLDSGIRPLNLTDEESADIIEFMKTLTSPQFMNAAAPKKKE